MNESSTKPQEPEIIAGRYRILRSIGKGGMGAVMLVEDLHMPSKVFALKTVNLESAPKHAITALQQEFLLLAYLGHPNIPAAHDFGRDTSEHLSYFTCEHITGENWQQATSDLDLSNRKPLLIFLDMAVQVLRALEYMSLHGLVHNDVKPENVLIANNRPATGGSIVSRRRAVLIDFGLAREKGIPTGKKILGTPFYVAPETILGSYVDGRTDLYSLGVVLYQLATGSPPFQADSNVELLRAHTDAAPEPPHLRSPKVPVELSEIILRLLSKSPEDRYPSASAVILAINESMGCTFPLETRETAVSHIELAALEGRQSRIRELHGIILASTRVERIMEPPEGSWLAPLGRSSTQTLEESEAVVPQSRLVLLRGDGSAGRAALARRCRAYAQLHGIRYLLLCCEEGRCDLARLEQTLVATLPGLHDRLGREADEAVRSSAAPPRAGARALALALLQESEDCPLVLHLEEAQYASPEVVDFVAEVAAAASDEGVSQPRALLIIGIPESMGGASAPIHRITEDAQLEGTALDLSLSRLEGPGIERLLAAAFPCAKLPAALRDRLAEESDGDLGVLLEVLRHILQKDLLVRRVDGWALNPEFEKQDLPGRIRSALRDVIEKLPEHARQLAVAFACLESPAELETAILLSTLQERTARRAIDKLRKAGLLKPIHRLERGEFFAFIQPSARSLIHGTLGPERLKEIHGKAGAILEAQARETGRATARSLAYHYLEAGVREKGIVYGVEAAREHSEALSPREAIETYRRVLSLLTSEESDLRSTVLRELSAELLNIGDYKAVLAVMSLQRRFGQRDRMPLDPKLHLDMAQALCRLGSYSRCVKHIDRAEQILAKQSATGDLPALLRIRRAEVLLERKMHLESLSLLHGQLNSAPSGTPWIAAEESKLAAESLLALNDRTEAALQYQVAIRALEGQANSRQIASGLYCRGRYHLCKDQLPEARRQFHLSYLLERKTSSLAGQAGCLHELGNVELLLGSPRRAVAFLNEAAGIWLKIGAVPAWIRSTGLLAEALQLSGEPSRAQEKLLEMLKTSGGREAQPSLSQTVPTLSSTSLASGEADLTRRYVQSLTSEKPRGAICTAAQLRGLKLLSELEIQQGRFSTAMDQADKGIVLAREAGEIVPELELLLQRAMVMNAVGDPQAARRDVALVVGESHKPGLAVLRAKARLLDALAWAQVGRLQITQQVLADVEPVLAKEGAPSDLCFYQLQHGLLCLQAGDLENAFLRLEEAAAIARRIKIRYLQAQGSLALGLLDAASDERQATDRAEQRFREAEGLSVSVPYGDILWRSSFEMGKLLIRMGRADEGNARLAHARQVLLAVLHDVPDQQRETYLDSRGAGSLLEPQPQEESAI